MTVSTLFGVCYELSAALASGKHDDLTAANVLELAEDFRVVEALRSRLSLGVFSELTVDEIQDLNDDWGRLGDFDLGAFGLTPDSRGLGLLLIWVLQRVHQMEAP
jgi:hypothetical protein